MIDSKSIIDCGLFRTTLGLLRPLAVFPILVDNRSCKGFTGKYHIFKICFVNLLKLHQYVKQSHFSLVSQIIIALKTRIAENVLKTRSKVGLRL